MVLRNVLLIINLSLTIKFNYGIFGAVNIPCQTS